jgi:hypothetical protein
VADPIFAVAVGVVSFYVYENRDDQKDKKRLLELIKDRYLNKP